MSKSELLGKMKGLLGGRAAEEIVLGEISTGASNDLEKVMQLAKNIVTVYGMSDKLPNHSLVNRSGPNFLSNGISVERRSEHVEKVVDEEVAAIINQCYTEAKELLLSKRELLEKLAKALLEKEVLNYTEIKQLLVHKIKNEEKSYTDVTDTVLPER